MSTWTPADVPASLQARWHEHMTTLTRGTRNVYLFAADQKVEHVLQLDPARITEIAQHTRAGALATHLGLLTRIDHLLRPHKVSYLVKLNGKTNLIPPTESDPYSPLFTTVAEVARLRDEGMPICGVGYTLYPGSRYEAQMLEQAARSMHEAHRHGLVGALWIYPRGAAIRNEYDGELIARAAGLAPCLGADIVKIRVPRAESREQVCHWLARAQQNAGNVRVICSGGAYTDDAQAFIADMHAYLTDGMVHGMAVGRNLFERPYDEAMRLDAALGALAYDNASYERACIHLIGTSQ